MKKDYLLAVFLVVSVYLNAQQITGLQVVEVLASDDFEDDVPWVSFDGAEFDNKLNNALGGTQEYSWSDAWGGACVHDGKSATAGTNCVQLHWGGSLVLQGFEIDAEKVYQLEVMIHPLGGISGNWNNWGAVHLFIFDNSNVWQSQGIRVRVSNNNPDGGSPALLAYDVWTGNDGVESAHNLLSFADQWAAYTIDDANDGTSSFWIPLKLVFKGDGTETAPFIMDCYLNDKFVETVTVSDLVWKGDAMIGLQNGSEDSDLCRYDDFRLSALGRDSGIEPAVVKKLIVVQSSKGALEVTSDIFGESTTYTLYDVSGRPADQGKLSSITTSIPVEGLPLGVYLLCVKDNKTGSSETVRIIVK